MPSVASHCSPYRARGVYFHRFAGVIGAGASAGGEPIQEASRVNLFGGRTNSAVYAERERAPGARSYALARERQRPVIHFFMLALIATGLFSSYFLSQTFQLHLGRGAPISGLSLPSVGAPPKEKPVLTSGVLPDTIRSVELEGELAAELTGDGQAAEGAEAAAAAVEPVELKPSYTIYSVKEGDTASAIAEQYGVSLQYLLWNNAELRDKDFLAVGVQLFIPAENGILHYMSLGETLGGVAAYYNVPLSAVLAWEGNGIATPDLVIEGQLVFVPGGEPPAIALPQPEPPAAVTVPPPPPAVSPPTASSGLIWPFSGRISSYLGDGRGHRGIDIDGVGNPWGPAVAATSGTVLFAGGNACCSLGLYVRVLSGDGILTVYAHLSSIAVSQGQQVSQGTQLGNIGCTGRCTGNHLHFEVWTNGGSTLANPLDYLP